MKHISRKLKDKSFSSNRFSKKQLIVFGLAFGLIGGYIVFKSFAAVPTTANLWIDTNGGSCTYSASGNGYSDTAACGSFDQAYDVIRAATGSNCGGLVLVKAGTYAGQSMSGYRTCSSNNPTVFQPEGFDCDLPDWPTADTPVKLNGQFGTGGNIFNDSPQNAVSYVTICGITGNVANVPNTNASGTVNDNSRYGIGASASYRLTFKRVKTGGFAFFWNGFTYNSQGPSGNITVINSNIGDCHEYTNVCGNGKIDGAQNINIEHNYIHDFRSLDNCTNGGAVDCGHQEPMFLNYTEGVTIKRNRFWNNEQSASGAYITISGWGTNNDIVGTHPAHKDLLIENNWGESPHNTCPGCQAPDEGGERGEPLFGAGHCEGAPAGQQYVNLKIRNNTAIGAQAAVGFGGGTGSVDCVVSSGQIMVTGNIANQVYSNQTSCTNLIYDYNITNVYPTLGRNHCSAHAITNTPIGDIVVNGSWGDVNQDAHLKSANTVASGYVPAQYCPTEDFNGNPRPLNTGFCAAGAFEYGSTAPAEVSANVWVDPNGGSCTRSATPVAYSDGAACASFAAAYATASAGDTVRIKAGAYQGPQSAGSNTKGGIVTMIGEDGTRVVDPTTKAQDIAAGASSNCCKGLSLSGNVTVRNVDVGGPQPFMYLGGNIDTTWEDSTFEPGTDDFTCGYTEPILIQQTDVDQPYIGDITLRNVIIGTQTHDDAPCGSLNDPFHLEQVRVDGKVDGLTFDRVTLESCIECGSGQIFFTTPNTGVPEPRNVTVRNSIFKGSPNYSWQMHDNVNECVGWDIAYNTFANDRDMACSASISNVRWIGNLGPKPSSGTCFGTYIKNVWQHQFDNSSCGTDKWVSGDSYSTNALGLDNNFRLTSSSPAIDAAETPSASDYCTSTLGSRDFAGTTRPQGSVCDAGAYEFTGTSSPPPSPPPSGGDTQNPSVPQNTTFTATTTATISLSWSASTDNVGIAGYRLYLNGSAQSTTTSLSYTFTGLTCNTTYTIGLTAFDAAGNESDLAQNTGQKATAACSGAPKQGDLNNDGLVNIFDLSILLTDYGKSKAAASNPACDINNDNNINIFDMSILLSKYGT